MRRSLDRRLPMNELPTGAENSRILVKILAALFAIAMVMGPGPGLYLVNPDPGAPESATTVGNVPVLYLWALFWYAVQVVVLLVAYLKVWGRGDGSV